MGLERSLDRHSPGFGQPVADGSTPSLHLRRIEDAAQVANAIERLPPLQRTVIQLRFFEDRSFEEIAGRVGKSLDNVRQILHRRLERPHEELGADQRALILPWWVVTVGPGGDAALAKRMWAW